MTELFNNVYESIELAYSKNKEEIQPEYSEYLNSALSYSTIRFEWNSMSIEEKQERDAGRTAKHNKFISNLKVLRNLIKIIDDSIDISSIDKLLEYDRKFVGDYACYLVYRKGLDAR